MKFLKTTIALISAVILSACVSAPPLQTARPKNTNAQEFEVKHSALLDDSNHVDAEKNIIYFQNQGGGGVAVGLLLGPFGVAANAAMINAKTNEDIDAIKNKVKLNPIQIFTETAKTNGLQTKAEGSNSIAKASPYVYIVKSDDQNLLVASALLVEQTGAEGKWTGKYMYQLPITTTVDELSKNGEALSKNIEALAYDGFSEIIKSIKLETQEKVQAEKKIIFKSSFVNPRFDFDMLASLIQDNKDVVWIRTFSGVYALNKKNISYRISKE